MDDGMYTSRLCSGHSVSLKLITSNITVCETKKEGMRQEKENVKVITKKKGRWHLHLPSPTCSKPHPQPKL